MVNKSLKLLKNLIYAGLFALSLETGLTAEQKETFPDKKLIAYDYNDRNYGRDKGQSWDNDRNGYWGGIYGGYPYYNTYRTSYGSPYNSTRYGDYLRSYNYENLYYYPYASYYNNYPYYYR